MEPIRIFQSQKRMTQSLIAALFAFSLFLILVLFAWEQMFSVVRVLSVFCVPAFGAMSVYYTYRLFQKERPLVVLDRDGLHDASSPFGVGLIRWEEIVGETPMMYNNLPYLRVDVASADKLVGRLPAVRRIAVRARLWFMRAEDFIPVSIQNCALSPEEILQSIRRARLAAAGSPARKPARKPAAESGGTSGFSKYDS